MMLGLEYNVLAKVLRELGEATLADQAAAKARETAPRRKGRQARELTLRATSMSPSLSCARP